MIGDLIQRVVNAIIRQEGEGPDSLNPGNLRLAPWYPNAVIENGFWKPPSRIAGEAGIAHVFALHLAQGNTLTDFIAGHPGVYSGYAPGADGNKPAVYIADVMAWTGVPSATEPMWDFLETPAT